MKLDAFNKKFDKLVIPSFIVLLTFISAACTFNLLLTTDELIKIDGVVNDMRIIEERTVRGRTNMNFYIYLNDKNRYKIMDDNLFLEYRKLITNKVKLGDSVTIFKRTQLQTSFGLGTANLI